MLSAAEPAKAAQAYERHSGAASAKLPSSYLRREPEGTVLHAAVREHLATFLVEAEERSPTGVGLPRFVREEFERYLRCGILAHGFARVHCGACGHDLLVAFSCKNRGVCPSCSARRMHDTAIHLTERVLPHVPVRQWVLALPRWARWALARDPDRINRALASALKAIFALQRRRARGRGIRGGHCGAISFVQRFGDSLNLNVHFHCAIPDGVFVMEGAQVRFEVLPAPTDAELDALLRKIARRLIRLLRPPADAPEPDTLDFLETAQHAALSAFQPARNGAPPKRKRHSAFVEGFSLHAGVHLHANDREGLARLLAYGARGPIALERLGTLPDGRLTYQLKRPLPDGRTELVLQPTELLRKLATLVPPPRRNLVRYHGLFAPHSALRAKVVASASGCARDCSPDGPVLQPEPTTPVAAAGSLHTEPRGSATASPARAPSRVPWAELLSRVFKVDVLKCENCGGRMTVLAFLTERAVVKKILEHLGLPATGPPKAPARGAAQLELDERPADELRDELPDYDS